jgi:hypothetical protein
MRSGPVWILQISAATKSLIKLHDDGARLSSVKASAFSSGK